jgi:hypothetical protein
LFGSDWNSPDTLRNNLRLATAPTNRRGSDSFSCRMLRK